MTQSRDAIRSKDDYRAFLAADLAAHGHATWRPWDGLRNPELAYQRLMRKVEWLGECRPGPLGRLRYIVARVRLKRRSTLTGLSVPPGVFGRGLSIAHVGSVVVNDRTVVGRYCRIHSATNIGIYDDLAPTIGDFVYIAPGAVLYGGITVGSGVVVGANSVVGDDVPNDVTVAGAPATVVSQRNSATVMPSSIQAIMAGSK